MLINSNQINKVLNLSSNTVITRGKKYYEQNKVKIIETDIKDDNNYTIYTNVQGTRLYSVNIKNKNGKLSYSCNCPYCDGYDIICKHIIATLFDIYTNEEEYKKFETKNLNIEEFKLTEQAKRLLERLYGKDIHESSSKNYSKIYEVYEKKQINDTNKDINEKVKIVPAFEELPFHSGWGLRFMIGINKMYYIKNLHSFISSVKYKEQIKYGKELEINHEIDLFDERAKQLLSFIISNENYIEYSNRFMRIEANLLEQLFDIIKNDECFTLSGSHNYADVYFKNKNPNLTLEVKEDEYGDLVVKLKENIKLLEGIINSYIISENVIYKCSKEFTQDTAILLKEIKRSNTNSILINKNKISSFINYTIPYFENHLKVKCDEKIKLNNKIEKLGVKVFLDIDEENNIICDVKYCYGNNEFNPLILEKIQNIKSRNLVDETKAENLFDKYGFEVDIKNAIFVLKDEEKIYSFFTEGINEFMQKFEVLATDKIKTRKVISPKTLSLGVKMQNNLIELNFSNLDFDMNQIKEILKMYKIKKKFFRLKNGDFIDLQSESISQLSKISENLEISDNELKDGKVYIPKYRAIHINNMLNNNRDIKYTRDELFKNIINDIDNIQDLNFEIPKELNGKLRNYQEVGYNWLKTLEKYNFGGILADDMGLGKTIQVITLLLSNKSNNKLPSIVVCPSSLYLNWQKEINKFAPELKVLTIYGSATQRQEYIKEIKNYDVIITSYDLLKRDIDNYIGIEFKFIIADEAQYIKNTNTQNAKALKSLISENRFALTGTPIENSLSELWSIFDFIMPGYLFSYKKFKEKFEKPIVIDKDIEKSNLLNQMISPFVLRRIKKDVLDDLPDKTETILYNKMDEEQEKVYKAYLTTAQKELQQEILNVGFDKSQIKILALITRLRQICCHPKLFIENYEGKSSKLIQCIDVLKETIESGHKVLIFSGFTSMFEIIEEELNKVDIKYYKLTGQTKVDERIELVEKFNNLDDIKVFLVSLKAGGTGLNLIGADVVMHFDPWWNLSLENQATDRAYRIGQKNNVQVFKYITEDSIEEKIQKIQENKKDLIDKVIKKGENFITKLSKDDILKLFE